MAQSPGCGSGAGILLVSTSQRLGLQLCPLCQAHDTPSPSAHQGLQCCGTHNQLWPLTTPTLGGDGVLRAAWGGTLCAVAAGALQRVPAAPLRVQLQTPRQCQGQLLTSLHLIPRLQVEGAKRQMSSRARRKSQLHRGSGRQHTAPRAQAAPHPAPPARQSRCYVTLAVADTVMLRGLCASSAAAPGPAAEPAAPPLGSGSHLPFRRCKVLTSGWS